ncbi:hypothetical protein U2T78_001958 [Providencia stuartii]|uniref:hypothetical protein n=1 Tax=Providencia stuartii TaxID=588 RepID=UPI0013CF69B1|nr:hypothetical protein [Providencia stuartii]EMA3641262.1 hypothetical protein [Providencia stuartii]MBG5917643.1 hypothetical protein [Providencia stuartii]MBN5560972.1 hypothetical protein [Providencia stuartii]MBW3099744.1 hypothetical protein [Providencia stuartii]MCB5218920.1 hypothetical protein [Providencia stuartii]
MDILTWPKELEPSSLDWQLISNTKTFISTFTGSAQTVRFPGSHWRCDLALNNLTDDKSRILEVILAQLDGESGRIRLFDWARRGVDNVGAPVVNQPNQTGRSLLTKGWIPNSLVLRAADNITINHELKKVTSDVISDAEGNATIVFSPMLRNPPSVGEKIEVQNPYGIFKLTDNNQGRLRRVPGIFTSTTLSFEEALY